MTDAGKADLLLGFPEYREPAQALADKAGLPYTEVELHTFPDGETRVRLPDRLPQRVVLCRSLDKPNNKLIELELAAATARELGAQHLTLVAPYLCYMRQDTAFQPGEAVSQRIIGALLARRFDSVISVDPHLHRVACLKDAVPAARVLAVSATGPMSAYLATQLERPFLLGPDAESEQWVRAIAERRSFDYAVADKQRVADYEVRIRLPARDYKDRHLVLVDDIASTGRTLEAAARQLAECQPASLTVLVCHALFSGDALQRLRAAGVNEVCSTDSIPHSTNRLKLAALLADAL